MTIRVSFQGGGSSVSTAFSAIYFGTQTGVGSWIITTSGSNLIFAHYETGNYVEKSAITTN